MTLNFNGEATSFFVLVGKWRDVFSLWNEAYNFHKIFLKRHIGKLKKRFRANDV